MNMFARLIVAAAVVWASIAPATAQDIAVLQYPTGCAPLAPGTTPDDAPRIIGIQDPLPKTLYGPRDMVIINAGTGANVQIGQRFYVRRDSRTRYAGSAERPLTAMKAQYSGSDQRPIVTTGGLRIVAANENMSIGQIDLGCDGIHPGDYLELLPDSAASDARSGESDLDFSSPSQVLYGDYGKMIGGRGELMFAELQDFAAPGLRYAIYRDLKIDGVPLAPVGEAVVVSVDGERTLVRLTQTRDSIRIGDLLIPHRP